MKFILQCIETIPDKEAANEEEKKHIHRGVNIMYDVAVFEMLSSFVLSGDTESPVNHSETEIEKSSVVKSLDSDFATIALFHFFKNKSLSFKVVKDNGERLKLSRVQPYILESNSPEPKYNPPFLERDNIVLLVAAPRDSYKTNIRYLEGNRIECCLKILQPESIKSVWCRRGDIKDWFANNPVPVNP